MKTCSKCKVEKEELNFAKCLDNRDGLQFMCRNCHKEYSKKNPESNREKSRRYRQRHPTVWKERYNSDPTFRVTTLLRSRIRKALKWLGANKSESTKALIGCPVVWLEVHLESLFKPGMTWENQGSVWHIDHVRPCSNFDLTNPEQQKICFHWTNQQPLFARENITKGAKYNG